MITRVLAIIGILLVASISLFAQKSHEDQPNKRVAIYIGHTLVPELNSNERFLIPSWGLDLDFWFNSTFGLGLHSDIEIETFIVRSNRSEELERVNPIVMTLDVLYQPYRGLILQIGPGIEIDPDRKFYLMRAGAEYEIQIGHHWDISPTIFYDHRFNEFGTWSIALGVGKRF